jgi:hypothetical protein
MPFMSLKRIGGYFDLVDDEWSQQRSYLNHTILSNKFRWALTPDRSKYAEAAIRGVDENQFSDPDEQTDFIETKKRINSWNEIKQKLITHAKKITTEFNPHSSGFSLLSSSLPPSDISWIQEIVRNETFSKFGLEQWITNVEEAVERIDSEMDNIRKNKSTVRELRDATDELISVYSGKGYFNYA